MENQLSENQRSDIARRDASARGRRATRSEFAAGAVAVLPIIISVSAYGLLLGSVGRQAGLSPLEILLMSATVFAGGSQFVVLELWREPLPVATLVNLRHLLMGATLGPYMKSGSAGGNLFRLFFLADEVWALAIQRGRTRGLTPSFYLGVGLPLYLAWLLSTWLGALIGDVIADPVAWGFDFIFAAVFLSLLAGLWQGPRSSLFTWLASGGSAALAALWLPGVWYILIGAGAGMAAAALKAGRS